MNIIRDKWVLVVFALVIGLLIGFVLTSSFYADLAGKEIRISMDYNLYRESEEALNWFREGSPIMGVYAQDRVINSLNHMKESNVIKEDQYAFLLVTLETRKGILYEEMGDHQKSSECFNNAAKKIRESDIKATVGSFKSAFKKLRKGTK
jgi:hypothetical protein